VKVIGDRDKMTHPAACADGVLADAQKALGLAHS
jgi:hypothetical protein